MIKGLVLFNLHCIHDPDVKRNEFTNCRFLVYIYQSLVNSDSLQILFKSVSVWVCLSVRLSVIVSWKKLITPNTHFLKMIYLGHFIQRKIAVIQMAALLLFYRWLGEECGHRSFKWRFCPWLLGCFWKTTGLINFKIMLEWVGCHWKKVIILTKKLKQKLGQIDILPDCFNLFYWMSGINCSLNLELILSHVWIYTKPMTTLLIQDK